MDVNPSFGESFAMIVASLVSYLPRLLVALAVVALGWLIGRAARALMTRLVGRLGRSRTGQTIERELRSSGMERLAPKVIGRITSWIVFIFFLAVAIEIAGLQVVTVSLGRLVQYLPSVVAGVLVLLAGVVLSSLARRGVERAVSGAGLGHGELLGKLARSAILLIAIVIALDQIGIESTLLIISLAILLATVVGGAALAFGLGARSTVEGFIAVHYIARQYRPGDLVRVGQTEGRIVEFTRTAVVLDTADGRALVPAAEFDRTTSVLLDGGDAP